MSLERQIAMIHLACFASCYAYSFSLKFGWTYTVRALAEPTCRRTDLLQHFRFCWTKIMKSYNLCISNSCQRGNSVTKKIRENLTKQYTNLDVADGWQSQTARINDKSRLVQLIINTKLFCKMKISALCARCHASIKLKSIYQPNRIFILLLPVIQRNVNI